MGVIIKPQLNNSRPCFRRFTAFFMSKIPLFEIIINNCNFGETICKCRYLKISLVDYR